MAGAGRLAEEIQRDSTRRIKLNRESNAINAQMKIQRMQDESNANVANIRGRYDLAGLATQGTNQLAVQRLKDANENARLLSSNQNSLERTKMTEEGATKRTEMSETGAMERSKFTQGEEGKRLAAKLSAENKRYSDINDSQKASLAESIRQYDLTRQDKNITSLMNPPTMPMGTPQPQPKTYGQAYADVSMRDTTAKAFEMANQRLQGMSPEQRYNVIKSFDPRLQEMYKDEIDRYEAPLQPQKKEGFFSRYF